MEELLKFSIIIPCYKTEKTVIETLQSVSDQKYSNWEAIIVNDGSPDNLETLVLDYIKDDDRFKYFKKINGGLGTARNYGIEKSTGDFILPLDSDNMVNREFLTHAEKLIAQDPTIDIIHGDAQRFGARRDYWKIGSFDLRRMHYENFIDACAIIKKSVFEDLGRYDVDMPYQGYEDWEFWLRCGINNKRFHYLPLVTFDYRVSSSSMIRSFTEEMSIQCTNYIANKHSKSYAHQFKLLYKENADLQKTNSSLNKRVRKVTDNVFYKAFKKFKG
jgi:glycosyltransferase involved in cell wall biosynthesis